MSFQARKTFSETELKEKELKPNFTPIIDDKVPNLEATLKAGLDAFSALDLSQAAKFFRKIANDLKHLESLITQRGNLNPRNTLNDLTGKEWLQHTKSWVIKDGKPQDITKEIEDHPGTFPPELVEHFLSFFTKKQSWVLDPFMGVGSTAAACWNLERNCIGVELNLKYFEYTNKRMYKTVDPEKDCIQTNQNPNIILNPNHTLQTILFQADARAFPKLWQNHQLSSIDFVITSPPYWNMLKTSRGGVKSVHKQRKDDDVDEYYSENPEDLGNIDDYTEYITALGKIFGDLKPCLKKGAYLMVILQNCRPKDGVMRPLAWDFAREMQHYYTLRQEFVWCQDQKFMGIWGWPTTYVSNVHHHYCLVFQNISDK